MTEIIGSALQKARQAKGLERAELASICCLSTKMILELEDGGITSFYSHNLKLRTAQKVGAYLGLNESDFLLEPPLPVLEKLEEADEEIIAEDQISQSSTLGSEKVPHSQQLDSMKGVVHDSHLENSASLEKVKWQEVLVEKVGGVVHENSHGNSPSSSKARIFVLIGALAVVGVYGLGTKGDVIGRLSNLFEKPDNKIEVSMQTPLDTKEPEEPSAKDDVSTQNVKEVPAKELNPAAPLVVALPVSSTNCPYKPDTQIQSYQAVNPSKPGDVVNIKMLVKQVICVTDGSGKQTIANIEANTAQSFKGTPPFVIMTQDLDNVEMFFQGWRVRPAVAGSKQIKLVEIALQ